MKHANHILYKKQTKPLNYFGILESTVSDRDYRACEIKSTGIEYRDNLRSNLVSELRKARKELNFEN